MTPDTYDSLFWSYTAVWAVLALYIWTLGVRVKRLESPRGNTQRTDERA
jgi:CcmD family protein